MMASTYTPPAATQAVLAATSVGASMMNTPPSVHIDPTDAASTLLVIASPQRKEKGKQGGRHEVMRGWTPEEDSELFRLHEALGANWKKIAATMSHANPRTSAMCRNRFLRVKKAQEEVNSGMANNKRGCFNKCGRCGATKKGHTCGIVQETAQPNLDVQRERKLQDLSLARPDLSVWAPERAGHAAAEQPAELCRPVEAELCDIQPTQDLSVSTASPGISSNVSPVTACAVPSALALASLSPFRATAASLPSPTEDSPTMMDAAPVAVAVVDTVPI